ncbi:MAG: diacylglycerol kinase family protein [Tannerellaceae bacterium]|nr:diacylglycerol kinase family protein [Tannerellaceae bacterium]
MAKGQFSFRKRIAGFRYAFNGMRLLLIHEHNVWIHLLAAVYVLIAGFFFRLSSVEWSIILLTIGVVFALEAVNTAIEKIADMISPEYHATIKEIKDLAAGAVLFVAISAAVTGLIIFVPKVIFLFR